MRVCVAPPKKRTSMRSTSASMSAGASASRCKSWSSRPSSCILYRLEACEIYVEDLVTIGASCNLQLSHTTYPACTQSIPHVLCPVSVFPLETKLSHDQTEAWNITGREHGVGAPVRGRSLSFPARAVRRQQRTPEADLPVPWTQKPRETLFGIMRREDPSNRERIPLVRRHALGKGPNTHRPPQTRRKPERSLLHFRLLKFVHSKKR